MNYLLCLFTLTNFTCCWFYLLWFIRQLNSFVYWQSLWMEIQLIWFGLFWPKIAGNLNNRVCTLRWTQLNLNSFEFKFDNTNLPHNIVKKMAQLKFLLCPDVIQMGQFYSCIIRKVWYISSNLNSKLFRFRGVRPNAMYITYKVCTIKESKVRCKIFRQCLDV